jgi:SulP family sulfate permease
MTVVLLPAIAEHGIVAVPILAVLAGIMVLVGGWLGLGRAVTYIPWPVVEGFTVGIAAIIFMQQLPLVLDVPRAEGNHNTLFSTIEVLKDASFAHAAPTIAVAVGVMIVMAGARIIRPAFPASLVAIVGATVLCWVLEIDVPTIGEIEVTQLIAIPAVPGVERLIEFLPAALIIALLAALESLLSARVADGMSDGTPTDPDRELVGQGLANIASGLVGGMPATGAIARTAVNVRAGARTRMASVSHGLVLTALLLGASSLLAEVPVAALAGVLMVTAINMVEITTVRTLIRHAGRSTAAVFLITAGTTILFDLARAVEVGILVAAVLVLRTTARQSGIQEENINPHLDRLDDDELLELLDEHVLVYRLQGSLFFGAAQHFLEELAALDDAKVIVLRVGGLHVLDATGAQVLAETIKDFRSKGVTVLLCGIRPQHARILSAVGIPGSTITAAHLFQDLGKALERARQLTSVDATASG